MPKPYLALATNDREPIYRIDVWLDKRHTRRIKSDVPIYSTNQLDSALNLARMFGNIVEIKRHET